MKIVKCKYCGKEKEVNIHCSNKYVCNECKNIHKIGRKRKCSICGDDIMYKSGGCSNEFCKKHNLPQIRTLIKYFGFNKDFLGTDKVVEEFVRIKNKLYKEYWIDGLTSTEICKKYNYPNSGNLTAKVFNYLEISSKNCHIALKEQWMNGIHKPFTNSLYKQQWHTTWDGNEVYLRSGYELDFAKELDEQKIHYEVENFHIKYFDTQKNEYRCSIPDFYIPETNTIYEIKSSYTYNEQNIKDKFDAYKKLGYNCKLILNHKEMHL